MADDSCPTLLGTLSFLKFPDIPNLDINQSIQPKIDDINNQLSSMSDFSSQGTLVVPSELSENQSNTSISSKFSDSNSKEVSIDESNLSLTEPSITNSSEQEEPSTTNSSEQEQPSTNSSEPKSESEPEDVYYTPASSESELSSMSDVEKTKKQSGGRKKKW
jgi:hypothetical protein